MGFDLKIHRPPLLLPFYAYEKERETVPFSIIGTMGIVSFPFLFSFHLTSFFSNYFLLVENEGRKLKRGSRNIVHDPLNVVDPSIDPITFAKFLNKLQRRTQNVLTRRVGGEARRGGETTGGRGSLNSIHS